MSEYRGIPHLPGAHRRGNNKIKSQCPACRVASRVRKNRIAQNLRDLRGGQIWYSQSRDPLPDWVAVQRAVDGQPQRLTIAERTEAVRILRSRGLTLVQIAAQLRVSDRTVVRHVARLRQQQEVAA